jgi:hypothetical protein
MRKSLKAIGLFGGLFHATSVTKIFHIFFYIICAIILQLTAYYPRKIIKSLKISSSSNYHTFENKGQGRQYPLGCYAGSIQSSSEKGLEFGGQESSGDLRVQVKEEKLQSLKTNLTSYKAILINKMAEQFKILEYSLIILFIITGAILLMSTSDLISMFLSIELQSYGLYILCTIYKNSEFATKGGLTYFLLGGLSSCFILLGSCLLYSNTGTTNLDGIYVITSLTGSYSGFGFLSTAQECSALAHTIEHDINVYEPNYINISLIIMTVGFLFKVSAAPFHF